MTRLIARRREGDLNDSGVYAILYAVLAVVLLGMGAIVVDFANVRQDRRIDRSATDNAVLGGAQLLQPGLGTPQGACLKAWDYLENTLRLSNGDITGTPCNTFAGYALTYCTTASPHPELQDAINISGDRRVIVAWPVPSTSQFLTPELAPGTASQNFSTSVDGSTDGCDRVGVAVIETEKFGLGGALSASSTQTQIHSVARFNPSGGPSKIVAALNILNVDECTVVTTTGTGTVLVDPVVTGSTPVGPGTVAVESAGTANSADWISNCKGGKTVVSMGGGGQLCASSVLITSAVACDGLGAIQLHELDDGVNNNGYNPSDSNTCPNDALCPQPTPENGTYRWNPITEIYGCNTTVLSPCNVPATNYIANLESAFGLGTGGGAAAPTAYAAASPYPNPYVGAFTTISTCSYGAAYTFLPAGNYYFNCNGLSITGTLVIGGGNVVLRDGNLSVGGCFIFNAVITAASATSNCANMATNGAITGTGVRVTTNPSPIHDGILFLRGGAIVQTGSMVMPQVFTYSKASRLNIGGGPLTLWTAPAAGVLNDKSRTTLEADCGANAISQADEACMASRFSRLVYWSDAKAVAGGGTENKFVSQGTLNLVGVFFVPRGSFHFGGGNCLSATSTQYWADDLTVEGGACVTLKPDSEFSETRPSGLVELIR